MKYIFELSNTINVDEFGGKAANLSVLVRAGLPVPKGFAVGLKAFTREEKLDKFAVDEIKELLDTSKLYAVRSSALAEDAEGTSWAGQFETFLNTKPQDVISKIEACHNSAKDRAIAYADKQKQTNNFEVAVVVQEMIQPEYAGVLFTKDPVTGADQLVTEYVEGLGEELVSGRSDPKKVILDSETDTPFDSKQLIDLSHKTTELFSQPQDIEWAWADGQIWLVQARPITVTGTLSSNYDLGESEDLFYWGPSRAKPMYMSDFMTSTERLFTEMAEDPDLPTPPKTLVLFEQGQMVWLNNAQQFANFTEKAFEAYKKRDQLDKDIQEWKTVSQQLPNLKGQAFTDKLIEAWYATEFAEFALYGAELYITKQLARFDDRTLPKIWGAFTLPDKPSFLNSLDEELAASKDPEAMAEKYPWIRDGYAGPNEEAVWYFQKRLNAIQSDGLLEAEDNEPRRKHLITEYKLSSNEVAMLKLARQLAEFMDDRKAWMMQTRRLLTESLGNIEHGWFFDDGKITLINKEGTSELWQRYVDFKSSTSAVAGTVANNGGRHFVSGEVAVLNSHVDPVEDDKILVVPSTSPGWVPLMRRARALVTDHGGMMSHAAIVAREFNLPCIVSTKQGTKVLKDGDKVVLDLVKGEIIR